MESRASDLAVDSGIEWSTAAAKPVRFPGRTARSRAVTNDPRVARKRGTVGWGGSSTLVVVFSTLRTILGRCSKWGRRHLHDALEAFPIAAGRIARRRSTRRVCCGSRERQTPPPSSFVLYQTEDGRTRIQSRFEDQTIWLSQALIAELFQTTPQNVTMHLQAIFEEGELVEEATCQDCLRVRREVPGVARTLRHDRLAASSPPTTRRRTRRPRPSSRSSRTSSTTLPRSFRAMDLARSRRHNRG